VGSEVELSIRGMDCPDCAHHVRDALAARPGVESAEVLLVASKAVVRYDPDHVGPDDFRRAVAGAGYAVVEIQPTFPTETEEPSPPLDRLRDQARASLALFGLVFGAVLLVVVIGEWLGLLAEVTARIPFPLGAALVLLAGGPVFMKVVRAFLRGRVLSHTLMTLGVLAALLVGQWATAAVVVFFMRIGDYAERFTAGRARRAVRDLAALAPRMARVESGGTETERAVEAVRPGEVVVVRPGEQIPVDGEVVSGHATVDQSSITGEFLPAEAGPGARVYAASLIRLGSLRIRATGIGPDTTFGRVIRLVEEAESHRADVQRLADRFSAWFLPVVAGVAALTWLTRHDVLAAAAVLVVACSCSFALATPMALLASVGAGARRGLLIKGGKYLEQLARADVVLLDKTGTLTLGRPELTDILPAPGVPADELLALAAAAEKYSEHPLAGAVRETAAARGFAVEEPADFATVPGAGVSATVAGARITVGKYDGTRIWLPDDDLRRLEADGRTLLAVTRNDALLGVLAASDTLRPEVPAAIDALRRLGIRHIELLTGDTEASAQPLAASLGIPCRAGLLPEDKIAVVRDFQSQGHRVVMVGDGVNDAPALAAADVGIAMGAAGSAVAVESAHIALLRDDWNLVPEAFRIARRTLGVVRGNLAFTAVYNLAGLTLASLGLLPLIVAAAAQSLPDLGILANSSRLLKQ
jgi:Cu+-exporting ATPase